MHKSVIVVQGLTAIGGPLFKFFSEKFLYQIVLTVKIPGQVDKGIKILHFSYLYLILGPLYKKQVLLQFNQSEEKVTGLRVTSAIIWIRLKFRNPFIKNFRQTEGSRRKIKLFIFRKLKFANMTSVGSPHWKSGEVS